MAISPGFVKFRRCPCSVDRSLIRQGKTRLGPPVTTGFALPLGLRAEQRFPPPEGAWLSFVLLIVCIQADLRSSREQDRPTWEPLSTDLEDQLRDLVLPSRKQPLVAAECSAEVKIGELRSRFSSVEAQVASPELPSPATPLATLDPPMREGRAHDLGESSSAFTEEGR
jgi:hypothetical protein